jgi:hypothetical protein
MIYQTLWEIIELISSINFRLVRKKKNLQETEMMTEPLGKEEGRKRGKDLNKCEMPSDRNLQ